MEYHQPDKRWEIYSINDFETYANSFIVKGQFHLKVHKDVVDSFMLCEYMMAHSYYHYPLFDEALSKLLRIIEMAVKLRCVELGISLSYDYSNNKTKETQKRKKKYNQLINDLNESEPNKRLKAALDKLRNLRNIYMHPEHYGYSGLAGRSVILFGVTIMNILFMPERIMLLIENETKRIGSLQAQIATNLCVLSINDKRILIEMLEIIGSVPTDKGWRYLIVAHPVLDIPDTNDITYTVPIIKEAYSIELNDNKLQMIESDYEGYICVEKTTNPVDILKYETFRKLKGSIAETDKIMYEAFKKNDIAKHEDEFWYKWLSRVEI